MSLLKLGLGFAQDIVKGVRTFAASLRELEARQ